MFTRSHDDNKKKPQTRSLALVLLAWVFIGGQILLVVGSMYNFNRDEATTIESKMPWHVLGQSATKMRLVAMQAQPDVIGSVAAFLAVANALGLVALMCGLLSWSRSKHLSGKLTIAAAMATILINSLLNLPYA